MAFPRPTLGELVDRIQQDFVSRLELVGAVLRRSVVYVLSRVIAGAVHLVFGRLDFLARQLFPDTAEEEGLLRFGSLFGVNRTPAEYASGDVVLTGVNASVVPVDTVLLRSDGVEYTTDAEATIASGTATVAVTAVLAGDDGNCDDGVVLTFESPVAGVDSEATVDTDGLSGGTDQEDIEDYRVRVLARMADPPQGGSDADYVAWAKEVSGVTRAWVTPLGMGAGTVVVRFVRDNDVSLIPDAGEVTTVQDYLDDLKPSHATVYVVAPTALARTFTIEITPDTSATRAAVTAELADLISREGEPGGTLLLSSIRTAIGIADGVTDYVLTVPAADTTHTANQIPIPGTITWV
jgi:uncharacterized phage protein gp47/JayE